MNMGLNVNGFQMPTLCQEHWGALRAEVEAQGLAQFVGKTGELEAVMIADQAKHGLSAGNFDPLMGAWFMIQNNAMRMMGQAYMSCSGQCIICHLNSYREADGSCHCSDPDCPNKEPGSIPDFSEWIKFSVIGQREAAQGMGLL